MKLELDIPEEMAPYADDIKFFVTIMVRKLHTNRHKGTGTELNIRSMLNFARGELGETEEALKKEGQFEVAVECADVANFVFLAARSALNMTRKEFETARTRPVLDPVEKNNGD